MFCKLSLLLSLGQHIVYEKANGRHSNISVAEDWALLSYAKAPMGVYTREVKEVLGEDVWEEIMRNVEKGVINENKMKEIAFSLTDKVGGNQTRRTNFDVHAMSDILSDWYEDELYDMDMETALNKLREIFLKSTLKLNILARFL